MWSLLGLRSFYHRMLPIQQRRALNRWLHRRQYKRARHAVYPSDKGTFSLRRYDELRTIFIHTPKAAGTSVALSIFGELPYHYTAADYITIFGRKTFLEYFRFSFVRNPWDRVHSAYQYLRKGGWDEKDRRWVAEHLAEFDTFEAFVRRGLAREAIRNFMHFRPQHEFVCDRHGRPLVNFLGYFETIDADFASICRRIGNEASLGHTNLSTKGDYREAYDDATRAIVASVYARDIELFGYDFDGVVRRLVVPN